MGKALAAWMMVASAIAAPGTGPRETIATATSHVFDLFQENGASRRPEMERRAAIRRITHELFDFGEVARRVLSRHWAARTPDEQTEFVGLFTDLLERAYLTRIEAFASDKVAYTGEVIDGPYATVRSRVSMPRTETAIDYRMHLRDGRWQVYDVLVDGVSFVSTFRAQFDRVIQAESYGALIERLRKRAVAGTQLSQGP